MQTYSKARGVAVAVSAVLVLSGCAGEPSYDANQCGSIDWFAMGKADGTSGQAMTALNDEITGCKPFGVAPDMVQYEAGRAEGLALYCQPGVILEASLKSVGDPFVCRPMSDTVQAAMDKGRETRAAVARYQNIKGQYDQLVQQRDEINQQGGELTRRYNATANEAERQQIAQRIGYLQGQRDALEKQIRDAGPTMQDEQSKYDAAVAAYESFREELPPVEGFE